MEDSQTSTSAQRLASTFEPLIESPEADINAIAVRPESLPTGSSRDIPVSVQELVYCSKAARVGTSPKSLDRHPELIYSNQSLVEKPKHVIRGSEEEVGPRQAQHPSGSSPSIHLQTSASTSAKQAQANPKDQSEVQAKGKGKGKAQVEQALPSE
ncbi:hypothetical protein O181_092722 [Austropuccinia psidii MF-1]|uniref:Uncharacterized protein n=1 Tax=Austropuccinia psidii MF-1 TaxID=1389203 RepID=A0A9Q3J018_9BASI|nr:hypothetical protein [Austropuccinia psidii MF-1]